MNKTHLLSVAVAAALASAAALAQTAPVPAQAKPRMQLDANKDGAIDRAEAARMPRLADRFDRLDANSDGKLTGAERPQPRGMRHRGGARGHGAGMGMRGWDADKDGRVSRAEAQAAQAKLMARFDAMDMNKDGYLDRADMQLRMRQQRDAFFAGADADRDGRLTRDEFLAGRQAHAGGAHAGKQAARGRGLDDAARRERAGAAFDRLDANHDGVVVKAELEAMPAMAGHGRSAPRR